MSEPVDPHGAQSPPPYQPPSPPENQPPYSGPPSYQPYPGAPVEPGYQPYPGSPVEPAGPAQPGSSAQPGYSPQPGYSAQPGLSAQPGYPAAPDYQSPPGGYPPGYPPPPGAWPGAAGGWTPAPPPSHTRRNVLIAALVAVVLIAAGIGIFFAVDSGDDGDGGKNSAHPHLPDSFAGYSQLHNAAADQVENSMRSLGQNMGGGAAARMFDAATIGVYGHNSGDVPVLITLAVPTSAAGGGTSPDEITRQILSGATQDDQEFPAGGHGGSTRCGLAQFGTVGETMCAWSDDAQSGVLVSVRESLSPADLAALTQKFRDAVE